MSLLIYDDVAFGRSDVALKKYITLLANKELSGKIPPEIINLVKEEMYSSDNIDFIKTLCLLNKKNNSIFNYKTIRADEISPFIKKFIFIRRISSNPKNTIIPRCTLEMKINIIPYIKKINGEIFFEHKIAPI